MDEVEKIVKVDRTDTKGKIDKIVKVDRTDTKGKIDKTDRKARNIDRYIDGDRQRWINRENPEKPTKARNEAKKKHMDK